jgi:hypothetical protein
MIQSGELLQKLPDGTWIYGPGFQTSPPQPDACDHDWKKIGQEPMPACSPSPPAIYIYKCNLCAKEVHSQIRLPMTIPKEPECVHAFVKVSAFGPKYDAKYCSKCRKQEVKVKIEGDAAKN